MEANNKSNGTPPIPMIPEDDMDESEEGFPLITSVFSLASDSLDSQKSPEKESTEVTSSKDTSQSVSVTMGGSPTTNGGNLSPRHLRMLVSSKPKPAVVDNKPGPDRNNAPYYVGKGKLILPKPKIEDNKTQVTLPQSTVSFSQMMSFSPQNNKAINSTTTNAGKESTGQAAGMMTRSAAHKINSPQPNGQVRGSGPGIAAPVFQTQSIPATSTSQPQVVKLANTVQILNVKSAPGQTTFPVLTPHTSSGSVVSSSVLSSSSPLVKLIKSISPNSTLTNVSLTPATTVASTTHAPVVVTPVASTPANAQVRSQRHINIAPAPVQQIVATTTPVNTGNTPRYVVVPKTGVSTPTIPGTQVVSTKGGVNIPRVVMVPNTGSAKGTTPATQVLYLVENQGGGDGKTYRLLFPERKVAGQPATTVPSQSPLTLVSANNGSIVSHTQLVRIIPKPLTTTVVNPQPKMPIVTQTSSSPTVLNLNVSKAAPVSNTGSITVASSEVASHKSIEKAPTAEKSSNEIPTSPCSSEEAKPTVESIDTGLSPHEARIQKLKELLKKQEEAIDRLKEKRQKEIDVVRAPPVDSSKSEDVASKRNSPFVVPLPPKKARLEQYRSKLKETNTAVKDGFLPNTDDTQFVKLVGLEKVVDKLKAKKMQELKESQALDSEGVNIMPS